MKKGRKIHGQGEQTREKGEFLEALKLYQEALVLYQQENDQLGFSETFGSLFLTFRHLYEKTHFEGYLVVARHMAMTAVELAEKSKIKEALALPYFNLAKAHVALNETDEAIIYYEKSLNSFKSNPPSMHNRPSILADMENHLAIAQYKNGDESALERANISLQNLINSEEQKSVKDIWVSGAYMRMAEAVAKNDPEKAKNYLKRAEEIVNTNPELMLRKNQLNRLIQKLNL